MANYAPSVLATAQTMLSTKYNEAELRRKQRPAINLAVKNQDYAIENVQQLKSAEARAVDVFYKLKKAAGSATAKVARHTGGKGDSAKVTLSWNTLVETFRISQKQAQNNVVGFDAMFQHEMDQAIQNLLDRAETAAVAYLVAQRLQTAAPATSGAATWNNTNKAFEVALANKEMFVQMAKTILEGRLFRGSYDAIVDLKLRNDIEKYANQGSGNSTNTAFQFPGFNHAPTTDTILGAYTAGSALVMPAGQFAGLVWNDPLNRQGVVKDAYVGMMSTMQDPYGSGITFDVSMYSDRADESAAQGGVQDIKDEWEISMNIGWALPPISTASESIVHLIAQLAA